MTLKDFITERQAGAKKIAEESRAKGGLEVLTAIHFEAKDRSYRVCLGMAALPTAEAIKKVRRLESLAAEGLATMAKEPPMEMFLRATGQQEVYGECLAFLFDPTSVERLAN